MNNWLLILMLLANMSQCSENGSAPNTSDAAMAAHEHFDEIVNSDIDTSWTEKVVKSKAEWKKILTADQYYITREQGTERPFSSPLNDNHDKGVFICLSCKNPLFSSETKFNSGTGWPSFYAPFYSRSLQVSMDNSQGMVRDEISCARCDAHLGHVFNDGPKPTGLRYCMDGVALQFVKNAVVQINSKALFAAGCFWCLEAVFENIKGVKSVVSGYAGGTEKNPTYEQVGSGITGHAEAVEVVYDPSQVSFKDLVRVFFAAQDPTQVNGQGPDHGTQYRTIAFYRNSEEKKIIEDYIASIKSQYSKPIAAQVVPIATFWLAEDYHQDYVKHHPENPYVQHESIPRMNRAFAAVKDLLKKGM